MKPTRGAGRLPLLAFAVTFLALIANGRAIGSGDTHAAERTAASLATSRSFVLPDGEPLDPFTRATPGGRVSIYSPVPPLIAAPFFALFHLSFDLAPGALQVVGKMVAALLAALATAVMAWVFARRASPRVAFISALLFGLGTSVYSTAQALWQHPAAILFLAVAAAALEEVYTLTESSDASASTAAALSLALAVAARPACLPMCVVLFLLLLRESKTDTRVLLCVAALPMAAIAFYNQTFFGAPWRFGPTLIGRFFDSLPESIAGLLFSPSRGLLIFTPIAALGAIALLRKARHSMFSRGLLAAALVHFAFVACWNEWHGGESFGPRLLADFLPLLLFFLPEAMSAWPGAMLFFGVWSIAVQGLGGWTYDYRWERLHQRGRDFDAALWSWKDSPITFALSEGVVIQGKLDVEGRRIRLQSSRYVPFGPGGSSIAAGPEGLVVEGSPVIKDVRLERGARRDASSITLAHPADALAFRIVSAGSTSVRITGSLRGKLRLETAGETQSFTTGGAFDVTAILPATSGEDIYIRAESGELKLQRVETATVAAAKP